MYLRRGGKNHNIETVGLEKEDMFIFLPRGECAVCRFRVEKIHFDKENRVVMERLFGKRRGSRGVREMRGEGAHFFCGCLNFIDNFKVFDAMRK